MGTSSTIAFAARLTDVQRPHRRLLGTITSIAIVLSVPTSAGARSEHGEVSVFAGGSTSASAFSPAPAPRGVASVSGSDGVITFDDVPLGSSISDQYADYGILFGGDSPFTASDRANPTSPVLSGTPKFFGEITGTFTIPGTRTPAIVNGFRLDVGYIDNRNSVEVAYYDLQGQQVGSVRANSFGINTIQVDYRGVASFRVRATTDEPQGFAIDNVWISRVATGIEPKRLISFGDSYTSGEGLLPGGPRYDCGTDLAKGSYYEDTTVWFRSGWRRGVDCVTRTQSSTEPPGYMTRPVKTYENLCHRHAEAYPNLIRTRLKIPAVDALLVACSGATTLNLGAGDPSQSYPSYAKSPYNVAGGKTQFQDSQEFVRKGAPDFVMVSIGGNDSGLPSLIHTCLFHNCLEDRTLQDFQQTVDSIVYPRLAQTFDALRTAFPRATIVSFGYPRVFDPDRSCAGVHGLGGFYDIGPDERRWAEETGIPYLNGAVADASVAAGITFVDTFDVTKGHEICTKDPWLNGGRFGNDKFGVIGNESFHPNQKAHKAITEFFIKHYTDGSGRLNFTNPTPSDVLSPPSDPPNVRPTSVDANIEGPCGAGCVQASVCVGRCLVHLSGQGFDPDATVTVTLDSAARAGRVPASAAGRAARLGQIGSLKADRFGRIAESIALPRKLRAGLHYLDLTAPDAGAGAQASTTPFQVAYARAPTNPKRPRITGRAAVGSRLTCVAGAWKGAPWPRLTYGWLRNRKAIRRAVSTRYVVGRVDRGQLIACRVTASNAAGYATKRSADVRVR